MLGYGANGKIHSLAYKSLRMYYDPCPASVKLISVCAEHKETARKASEQAGYHHYTTNYRETIMNKNVDIVDCLSLIIFTKTMSSKR